MPARRAVGLSGCTPCRLTSQPSASIPRAFAPAALRTAFASRGKPTGLSPPRMAWRPLMPPTRLRGSARSAPRHVGRALMNTLALAAAGCANACRPRRWRFAPITSRRTVHGQPARHRHGASTPRLKTGAAGRGGGVLVCRWVVALARVGGRAGAAFGRGCRVGPVSFRIGGGSAQSVLVLL